MGNKYTAAEEARKSVFLVPAIVVLGLFFIVPIIMTFYYSFTNLALSGAAAKHMEFVGFDNYKQLFQDRNVKISIINTFIFLAGCLVGQQVIGFSIALLMKSCSRGFRSVIGPIIIAGWVMPEIVVALCMGTFFAEHGTINNFLGIFSLAPVQWLFKYAMLSVILANIWRGTAFSMMNFQSALDNVPNEVEEAARVDGANYWQTLIGIIIPCIKGTIGTNTMLNTLSTLGVFGLIYTLTGGGPGTKTLTLPIIMYRQAFVSAQLGYGTAISIILLSFGIFLSVIYTRLIKE